MIAYCKEDYVFFIFDFCLIIKIEKTKEYECSFGNYF